MRFKVILEIFVEASSLESATEYGHTAFQHLVETCNDEERMEETGIVRAARCPKRGKA